MRKLVLLLLFLAPSCGMICAQTEATAEGAPDVRIIDRDHAQDWTSDIVTGWRVHDGDDPAWANPTFDDSAWETVRLDDLGASKTGWTLNPSKAGNRWFRLRLKLHENHPDLALLIDGGEGAYALYLNGVEAPGPGLGSNFSVKRPTERTIPLNVPGTDLEIALRTSTPPSYRQWHLPLFLTVSLGTPDSIENERQSLESARIYSVMPAIGINLLLMLAGITVFALYRSQPQRREYLWLGLYLFLQGTSVHDLGIATDRNPSALCQLSRQRSLALPHRLRANRIHIQLWRSARWPAMACIRVPAACATSADLAFMAGSFLQRRLRRD